MSLDTAKCNALSLTWKRAALHRKKMKLAKLKEWKHLAMDSRKKSKICRTRVRSELSTPTTKRSSNRNIEVKGHAKGLKLSWHCQREEEEEEAALHLQSTKRAGLYFCLTEFPIIQFRLASNLLCMVDDLELLIPLGLRHASVYGTQGFLHSVQAFCQLSQTHGPTECSSSGKTPAV